MDKYVYKLTNKINGKVYIGQTNNMKRRIQEHKHDKRAHKPIHEAIKKYGFENFDVSVEYFGPDYNAKEKELIAQYQSQDKSKGYNIKSGGEDSSGEDNPMAKITTAQKVQVENLLLYSEKSMKEISEITNVSLRTVGNINIGAAWRDSDYPYPLRQNRIPNEVYQNIIEDLINTEMSFDDIADKYNVKRYVVLNVNKGVAHKQNDLDYPLRKIWLSKEDIEEIIWFLRNTDFTQKEISEMLNVKYSTVYRINSGTSYRQPDTEYPIRKCTIERNELGQFVCGNPSSTQTKA